MVVARRLWDFVTEGLGGKNVSEIRRWITWLSVSMIPFLVFEIVMFTLIQVRSGKDDKCPISTVPPRQEGDGSLDVGRPPDGAELKLSFNVRGGIAEHSVSWPAPARVPPDLSLASTDLPGNNNRLIDGSDVHVAARITGTNLAVRVCVKYEETPVRNGTYTGTVTSTDGRIKAISIPIKIEVQSKTLPYELPLVIPICVIAAFFAWKNLEGQSTLVKVLAISAALIAGVGAWISQGLERPTFGGPKEGVWLLVGMYGAATAAITTIAGRIGGRSGDGSDGGNA